MAVSISNALRAQLTDSGVDPEAFAREFLLWKEGGDADEYKHRLFGKDGAYVTPAVAGDPYQLRHVHIVPFVDRRARRKWDRDLRLRRRKTSDRHLVYVSDAKGNFGLIYVLEEPDAHSIARMQGPKEKAIMTGFATMAENFLWDGTLD